MSTYVRRSRGKGSRSTLVSTLTLASSRWKYTWLLLLIMTLGMTAAVIIVCTVPLFASVMNTASLRQTLRADPDSAEIDFNTTTLGLSTQVTTSVQQMFADLVNQDLGSLAQPTQFTIISLDYAFGTAPKAGQTQNLTLYGAAMQQAAAHLSAMQGHLASITTAQQDLQVMMTPDSAKQLGLKIGDTFPLVLTYALAPLKGATLPPTYTRTITAQVAGLFQISAANTAYWQGENFQLAQYGSSKSTIFSYTMLVPAQSLLALADNLAAQSHTKAIFSPGVTLRWDYQLRVSQITYSQLATLINDGNALQSDYTNEFGALESGAPFAAPTFPYLSSAQLSSSLLSQGGNPGSLDNFSSRIAVVQVPATLLTVQIILLILFFISLMTSLLIESQAEALALLRSRGASRSQIFGYLLIHCVLLDLLALVLGVPLTLAATVLLARHFLPTPSLDALTLVTASPWQAIASIIMYAGGVCLVMLVTMVGSLYVAARMDVLALRREAARTQKRPLWQRWNLDLFLGVVAIAGYIFLLYLNRVGGMLPGGTQALVTTPLSVVAPFFLVLGCLFLLLRVFPLLLRLGAWLAVRGKGAVSMLALAQVARSPRQSVRMTMLLALSIAFLLFTVVYESTQAQHIQDVTNYLASADFSGDLASGISETDLARTTRAYQAIPGVLAASIGFMGTGEAGTAALSMQIRGVDATNFGQTVIWPSSAAAQIGDALLKRLSGLRTSPLPGNVVPVLLDTSTLNKLRLHIGSTFVLTVDEYTSVPVNCLVIGVVPAIPSINDGTTFTTQGQALSEGGVLFDYDTFAVVFSKVAQQNPQPGLGNQTPPALDHLWLRSKDDAASLASVRTALAKLGLVNLSDRRLILEQLETDPLYLILSGTLAIGTLTALLLALIGNLLTSWLSARTKLTSVAVLRAIGSTPRQVVSMLTWEQAIVYLTGLLLGMGIGAFIVQTVIPALSLTDFTSNVTSDQFYALQTAFPTQIVLPASLLLALLALVAIYGLALTLMVRMVSQPSLSQTLRLNED